MYIYNPWKHGEIYPPIVRNIFCLVSPTFSINLSRDYTQNKFAKDRLMGYISYSCCIAMEAMAHRNR